MSERYMYKITYKLTPEQQYKMGMVSDGSTITQTILLDTIEDTDVTLDSTISAHPQLNGTLIADHMYRNPASVSISGVFGAFGGMSTDVGGNGPNMAMQYLQNLFETIKDNAIICKLSKIAKDDSRSSIRFKTRNNMVLQKITWSERLTSMKFNFEFVEVMTAKVQEYSVDITDSFLPGIDILQSISFTQEVISWEVIWQLITYVAISSGWVDARIVEQSLGTAGAWAGVGVGAGAAVGAWITSAAIAAGASSSIPVAGWIVGAVVALAIIGYGIWQATNDASLARTFTQDQLTWSKDDEENRRSVEKFNLFKSNVYKEIVKLDNSVTAYSMNITDECEFYVNFENNYYYCEITRGQTSDYLNLKFCNMSKEQLGPTINIKRAYNDLMRCNSAECIYRLPYTGSYVYVIRKYNYEQKNVDPNRITGRDIGEVADYMEGKITVLPSTITIGTPTDTYYLVATRIAPEKFTDVITSIIKTSIMRSVN